MPRLIGTGRTMVVLALASGTVHCGCPAGTLYGGAETGAAPHPGQDPGGNGGSDDAGPDVGGSSGADPGAETRWRFFVMGDTRTDVDTVEKNARSMVALDPNALGLFVPGDITDTGAAVQWDAQLQAFANAAPDPSVPTDPLGINRQSRFRTDKAEWGSYIRYVGVLGNHDVVDASWHTNWNSYLVGQRGFGQNSSEGVYFTLEHQNALFIILDSQHPGAAQTGWLGDVLESDKARRATWKLAFFHQPVYPCNAKAPFHAGLQWVALFERHGVDVAFSGHSHTYERTCPMIDGECALGGVIHVNTSGGGAPAREVDSTKTTTVTHGELSHSYDCAAILEGHRGLWHHFVYATVDGCRLTLEAYAADYVDDREPAEDAIVIDKCGLERAGLGVESGHSDASS